MSAQLYTTTLQIVRTPLRLRDGAPAVTHITDPSTAAQLLSAAIGADSQEHLVALSLNAKNEIVGITTIHIGGTNSCFAEISNILRVPLLHNAMQFLIAHNHPSGDPTPSPEDLNTTRSIVAAAQIMGLELCDHLIVTWDPNNFHSIRASPAGPNIFDRKYTLTWQTKGHTP